MNRPLAPGVAMLAPLALGACGQADEPAGERSTPAVLTAATLGEQAILPASDYLAESAYAGADLSRGETLSMQCRACHTLEAGGATVVGPNLFGMFGRSAGAAEYDYSPAFQETRFVWTPRALDAWLAAPFTFLPGNRMSFPGVPDQDDRNALIAYLLTHTDSTNSDAIDE